MREAVDPFQLLADAFSGLRMYSPRFEIRVVEYLMTGSEPRLPSTLSTDDVIAIQALVPFSSGSHRLYPDPKASLAVARPGWSYDRLEHARRDFYYSLDAIDRGDDQVLVRLGTLLDAVGFRRVPDGIPRSVSRLLDDAARVSFQGSRRDPEFTTLSIDRLRSLALLAGAHNDQLDGMLIDLFLGGIDRHDLTPVRGKRSIPGIAAFLEQHLDLVFARLDSFPWGSVMEVLRHAGNHPPLALGLSERIATFIASGDREMRAAAVAVFSSVPPDRQAAALEEVLAASTGPATAHALKAIERIPDPVEAIAVIERALARTGVKRRPAHDQALGRLKVLSSVSADLLAVPALVPLEDHRLEAPAIASMRTAIVAERDRVRDDDSYGPGAHDRFDDALDEFDAIVRYLSGDGPHPGHVIECLSRWSVWSAFTGFEPANWIRLGLLHNAPGVEARAVFELLLRAGLSPADAESVVTKGYFVDWMEDPAFEIDQMWTFMAEHPGTFDVILGITSGTPPQRYIDHRGPALEVLAAAPGIAPRYLPVVTGYALGANKTHRAAAQRVLEKHGLANDMVRQGLRDSNTEVRRSAALWLESLGDTEAIELLGSRLQQEKSEPVRATILAVIERLGGDIRSYLQPEVLLAEATAGLAKPPRGLDWFPFDDLPACRYASGSDVPHDVLRWWVLLAHKLKDPFGAGLLPLYMKTLEPQDAQALSRVVLTAWIARDTSALDDAGILETAMKATAAYSRRLAKQFERLDLDVSELFDAFAVLEASQVAASLAIPSAIADRGLLALAPALPGVEFSGIVRQYMRRYHLKRAQIDALLQALSLCEDPAAIQLLLATGRRYRTAGIQENARLLASAVATRFGWSEDELADRMISPIGLDAAGELQLDFGTRRFTARIGPKLTFVLANAAGDPVKALPAPNKDDDRAGAAKAKLAASRKELTAIIAGQRRRLHEAMCVQREWSVSVWNEFFLAHPVMRELATRLVWQVSGDESRLVRPLVSGELVDVSGLAMTIAEGASVRLAHGSLLQASDRSAWQDHLDENGITPLFDQQAAGAVEVEAGQIAWSSHEGGLGESFTLRRRASARDWVHGETGDDVRFDDYVKSFPSLGLQAVVSFSGSQLPETSIPIVMGMLHVRELPRPRRSGKTVDLDQVPPVLLAELVADYDAMAAP